MRRQGRALAESIVLHGLLLGLVIVLSGMITPPPKTVRLEFFLASNDVAALRHTLPTVKASPVSRPQPMPKPRQKTVAHILPKPIKRIKWKPDVPGLPAKPVAHVERPPQKVEVSLRHENVAKPSPAGTQTASVHSQQNEITKNTEQSKQPDSLSQKGKRALLVNYLNLIEKKIEREKHYPYWARSNGVQGRVSVRFVLAPDGKISLVRVSRSSGTDCLDQAAVDAVRNAAPMPRPPHGILLRPKVMELTIVFQLT